MRLHVNLKNMAASRMVKLHRILIVAGKLAWPRYDLDTDYLNPWERRCRWCRYRMEGGGKPQRNLQNDEGPR